MRLRTFESFWLLKNGLLHSYPSLQKNITTEILVIGGGITGALISDALMEQGYEVTVVDRRDIGQGSTSATTSMLQYEVDKPLYDLSKKIGEEGAAASYKAGVEAILELERIVREKKIDCGFERKKSLYIAHSRRAARHLKKEFAIRDKHALGVQWLNADEVFTNYGIKCYGGILSQTAASVDAYKLAHELIKHNAEKGMRVYDQTEIKTIDTKKEKPQITTVDGYTITADKLVFCTGFETVQLLKENVAKLFFTYACVSEAGIKLHEHIADTLVWNTDDPYLYMRTTDDGRLLVGGEDAASGKTLPQQRIKERKSKKLLQQLQKIMPDISFIEDFSWGGTFGSTKDGLPYIGVSPEYAHSFFCLGFGGNGITFSVQGRQIIVELLAGKAHPLAKLYRFGR